MMTVKHLVLSIYAKMLGIFMTGNGHVEIYGIIDPNSRFPFTETWIRILLQSERFQLSHIIQTDLLIF